MRTNTDHLLVAAQHTSRGLHRCSSHADTIRRSPRWPTTPQKKFRLPLAHFPHFQSNFQKQYLTKGRQTKSPTSVERARTHNPDLKPQLCIFHFLLSGEKTVHAGHRQRVAF